jgi:lipid-A-disaccharide synthase
VNTSSVHAPLIFLIAGEPSGDALGAKLMASLKRETKGRARFAGIGGPQMAAEGLESIFPMEELSVMGLVEIIPKIPRLRFLINETVSKIAILRPDALVTIDSPGFTLRVAKKVAGLGFPLVHYVAPSVWAWKPGRAKKIARYLNHVLALLPFEPIYMQRVGLPCTFVGHPVLESGADKGDGMAFRKRHDIPSDAKLICMLPGSRKGEVSRLLPVYGEVLGLLKERYPNILAVVPSVEALADDVMAGAAQWPVPALVLETPEQKYDAFAASDVAIAASGTVTLELAMAKLPMIVAYKVHALTAWAVTKLVRVNFVSLINIMLEHAAIPEFLQDKCVPGALAAGVEEFLEDPSVVDLQAKDMTEGLAMIGPEGAPPSEQAAKAVMDVMKKFRKAQQERDSE